MKLTNSSAVPSLPDIVASPEKEQNMHVSVLIIILRMIHPLYNAALSSSHSQYFPKLLARTKWQTYQI